MAEDDALDRKESTERRVYNLPASLLERLRAYQSRQGLASEAEAARRLLDFALQMRDTAEDILNVLGKKYSEEKDLRVLASDVLTRHALVTSVTFQESGVIFKLASRWRGQITDKGALYIGSPDMDEDEWQNYAKKHSSSKKSGPSPDATKGGDLDDDIPF